MSNFKMYLYEEVQTKIGSINSARFQLVSINKLVLTMNYNFKQVICKTGYKWCTVYI